MKQKADLIAISGRDRIGTFDPLLASVGPKGDWPHYRGGYHLWPHPRKAETLPLRLMTFGNSTSLWPDSDWSRQLARLLTQSGLEVGLFHGAGKGNTSGQDVLRVIRDGAAIKPRLIVTLSGICDIGYLLNSKLYPFAHKYVRRMLDFVRAFGFAEDTVYGYPDPATPAQVWCRNQKIAYAVAQSLGIDYLVFLQPVMGVGRYSPTETEAAIFSQKAPVLLQAIGKPYGECVQEFYAEVQGILAADPESYGHVIDFTDVFADCTGAYRDHRHQSAAGVSHLARAMLDPVSKKLTNICEGHTST